MNSFLKYKHVNIDEVCRICLSKDKQMSFISDAGLPDLLFECASIQVSDEDILHLVCKECANEVSRWYIFKQQLMQSFEIGRWLIQQKKLKTVSDYQVINPVLSEAQLKISDSNTALLLEQEDIDCSAQIKKNVDIEILRPKEGNIEFSMRVPETKNISEKALKSNSTLNQFSCEISEITCPSKSALLEHEKIHKQLKEYGCTKCGKIFKRLQYLKEHTKRHHNLKKYSCHYCDKKFYKRYNITMHIRMHTGEKPYKCKECEKAFTRPLLLRNHIKQKHTNDKKHICEICEKGFIDGWQLKIHLRTHTGEKPYKCSHCEMTFAVTSSLHSHIRYKHTLEKNFICSMCAKAFTAKHTLDNHMRTHTGEKKPPKHACSLCGKQCDSTSTLKYHIRSAHTGEKPFSCELCEKKFLRKQHLTTHMRNHTGEKPYSCLTCGKTFRSSSTFSIHKRRHTGERPFVCSLCNSTFIQSAGLKQHMRTHTSNK